MIEKTSILAVFKDLVQAPPKIESNFTKSFGARTLLIRKLYDIRFTWLKERVFHDVLVGEDGWLYYTGEENLNYFQRVAPFSTQQLKKFRLELNILHNFLSQRGILLVFVVAPNKESIYPDHLPPFVEQSDNPARLDQLLDDFAREDGLEIIDLRSVLLSGRQMGQTYHATDTHWNDLGAYLAYRRILEPVQAAFPQIRPPDLQQYTRQEEEYRGDLSRLLPLSHPQVEQTSRLVPLQPRRQAVLSDDIYGLYLTEVADPALPRVVVFRDSFFDALVPYFSEHFSRAVYSRAFSIDYNLIEAEQPDVVVLEVAERYLGMLLENLDR